MRFGSLLAALALLQAGCQSFPASCSLPQTDFARLSLAPASLKMDAAPSTLPAPEHHCWDGCKSDKGPKTLLAWSEHKKKCKNGNGDNQDDEEADDEDEEEDDTIVTDRPDFTEATTTVGRGRIQLEAGYTYFHDDEDGTLSQFHSYPEMLWRIGMFADWFELRLGWNFGHERERTGGIGTGRSGSEDLYLGCKLALTEQQGICPEMALILQMTVPTGSNNFSADEVHPGFNLLYGWDVIPDLISMAGSTQMNRTRPGEGVLQFPFEVEAGPDDGNRHSFLEVAQSFTIGYTLTAVLGAYTEWFALFPHSSTDPEVGPEYYFNGGFTYLVTNNFQLDIRAGVGLNKHADDLFAGSGFSVRY
ncbi:MAG: transporter [Gemmataceae bacterium]